MGKINPAIPKTIRKWLDKNQDKFLDADVDSGYNTDSGKAYDILLNRGWCEGGNSGYHTLIEKNVSDMMAKLRGIKKCDCHDCQTGNGW